MIQLERTETAPGRILEITISLSSSSSSSKRTNNDNDNYKDIAECSQQTPYIVAFWLKRKLGPSSPLRDLVVRLAVRKKMRKKVTMTMTVMIIIMIMIMIMIMRTRMIRIRIRIVDGNWILMNLEG